VTYFARDRFAAAALAEPIAACKICNGLGLRASKVTEGGRTYDVYGPCEKKALDVRIQRFNAAQLPARHALATFASFDRARADHAFRTAQEFAHRWPAERGLIFAGEVGAGKTHLLVSILRHLAIELGVEVAYQEISLLYADIRRGFREGKSGGEIIDPLSRVEVLAIDELGKGRMSPFEMETLDELIARRYNGNKITLFATNYSLEEAPRTPPPTSGWQSTADLKAATDESKLLCDRVGDRIYSRLNEMCSFVPMPLVRDRRLELAQVRGSAPISLSRTSRRR
jgi:DNA replication protein DnaC